MEPINYVPEIEMFINVMLLLQYIRVKCLSIRCSRSKYTNYHFPSCSKVEKVHFSNHGYGHTSVTPPHCSNESLRLAFPECTTIANPKFPFILSFHVKIRCVVFLLLLAVKVLSDIGYLVPAFRRLEFCLQVFMTDFHSCRKGK